VSVLPDKEAIKKEARWLAIGFIALSIALIIAFRQSPWSQSLRTAAALYWLFVLPGYALALCSRQGFVERFIIGVSVQTAVIGQASYFAGLWGWHVATHGLVLPVVSIAIGVYLWRKYEAVHHHSRVQ